MTLQQRILLATPENFWFLALAGFIAAAVCFYLAFRNLGRSRLIADTPTSKVRSAAQGYVELEGAAEMMEGAPVQAPLSGRPCVWYRYKIEEYRNGAFHGRRQSRWHTVENGESDAIFHLRDDTGTCIVDPDGAHITASRRMRWKGRHRRPRGMPHKHESIWSELFSSPPYRYTEERIHGGDSLYAIGAFLSVGSHESLCARKEVSELLSRWKQGKRTLLQRFDLDGNGEIDLQEWELARKQAEREVYAARLERAQLPQFHLLKKPASHHQPFIISTAPQLTLISRYRLYAGLAVGAFLLLGAAVSWAISVRTGI